MPVDSSQGFQPRRTSRKLTNEDEIDLRRARGEVRTAYRSLFIAQSRFVDLLCGMQKVGSSSHRFELL